MSETHDTDGYVGDESDQDSAVIQNLRSKIKELTASGAEKDKKIAEFESQASTARDESAKEIVNALGFPGLKDDVLGWVEGEITESKVVEALKARSLTVEGSDEVPGDGQADDETPTESASKVGQRVADAAGGRDQRSIDEKLAGATTREEIREIMDAAGATSHYS